jgi:hypothetical protein
MGSGQLFTLAQGIVMILLCWIVNLKIRRSTCESPQRQASTNTFGRGIVMYLAMMGALTIFFAALSLVYNAYRGFVELILYQTRVFFLMVVIERGLLELRTRGVIAVVYLTISVVGIPRDSLPGVYNWDDWLYLSHWNIYTILRWIMLAFAIAIVVFTVIRLYRQGTPHSVKFSLLVALVLFWFLPILVDSVTFHSSPSDAALFLAGVLEMSSTIAASVLLAVAVLGNLGLKEKNTVIEEKNESPTGRWQTPLLLLLIEVGIYLVVPIKIIKGMRFTYVSIPLILEFLVPDVYIMSQWLTFIVGPVVLPLVLGISSSVGVVKSRSKGLPVPVWTQWAAKGAAGIIFVYCSIFGVGMNNLFFTQSIHSYLFLAFLIMVPFSYYHATIMFKCRSFVLPLILLLIPLLLIVLWGSLVFQV